VDETRFSVTAKFPSEDRRKPEPFASPESLKP
jgi:hypothetical protein